MRRLIEAVLPSAPLTVADFEALATARRDSLSEFLIDHAGCEVALPGAITLWYEFDGDGDRLRGWCRKCGSDVEPGFGALALDGDPRVWWLVIALGALLRHPDVMRTPDYLPTSAHRECVLRLEAALRYAVLLDEADARGVLQ